ncbi:MULTISPECIES: hypothetical protein [unclassified Novosphingobium]|uniref:hypothetical protein n=1 Tax=unclassified Novosphingobium TaxID=2644732 RepID=UPI000AF33D5D|nr:MULTISPECIES: hypothetical protein [unclassified Novosphingobium]MBN9142830.1 hypothetical protein [Novosphingobium sp.]MDR6705915.1 hypothetical protein [Novosphingobium sp. 1748]
MAANLIVMLAASGLVAASAPADGNSRGAVSLPVAHLTAAKSKAKAPVGCVNLRQAGAAGVAACEKAMAGPQAGDTFRGTDGLWRVWQAGFSGILVATVVSTVPPASSR